MNSMTSTIGSTVRPTVVEVAPISRRSLTVLFLGIVVAPTLMCIGFTMHSMLLTVSAGFIVGLAFMEWVTLYRKSRSVTDRHTQT